MADADGVCMIPKDGMGRGTGGKAVEGGVCTTGAGGGEVESKVGAGEVQSRCPVRPVVLSCSGKEALDGAAEHPRRQK